MKKKVGLMNKAGIIDGVKSISKLKTSDFFYGVTFTDFNNKSITIYADIYRTIVRYQINLSTSCFNPIYRSNLRSVKEYIYKNIKKGA